MRRRLRTILRELDGSIARGWDILLICRAPAAAVTQAELRQALGALLAAAGTMKTEESMTTATSDI